MANRGIGKRVQIMIISVTPVKEASTGLQKASEQILFSGWAEVWNPSGSRNYALGQDSLDHTKFFKIRHHQGITANADTRLIYATKRYTINSIDKDKEKNFYWIIRATARTEN